MVFLYATRTCQLFQEMTVDFLANGLKKMKALCFYARFASVLAVGILVISIAALGNFCKIRVPRYAKGESSPKCDLLCGSSFHNVIQQKGEIQQ